MLKTATVFILVSIWITHCLADNPTDSFKDAISKPLIANSQTTYATHGWDDLDPTVFIDDTGQACM